MKRIREEDKCLLEKKITMEEVSNKIKNTKDNVVPGAGGFMGSFYKVFWCYIKKDCTGNYP